MRLTKASHPGHCRGEGSGQQLGWHHSHSWIDWHLRELCHTPSGVGKKSVRAELNSLQKSVRAELT
eukprot:701669-Pyramimonas_sp.AAC.1